MKQMSMQCVTYVCMYVYSTSSEQYILYRSNILCQFAYAQKFRFIVRTCIQDVSMHASSVVQTLM